MNFLSHYFFDHSKNDHHFNFGLILPDLVRNFVPGTRIKPASHVYENSDLHSINLGCVQHIQTDDFFHQWEGFHTLMNELKTTLRNSGPLRPKRDWFVAHIFAELMIDHKLLHIHPEVARELYTSFEKTRTVSIDQFLLQKGLDKNRRLHFHRGFDRFMEVRYLTHYHEAESVVYSLERICVSKSIPPFDLRQKEYYIQLISDFDRIIVRTITELHSLLK